MNRRFKPGNREQLNKGKCEKKQAIQMCGRLEKKLEQLTQRHWKFLGRGQEKVTHIVEEEKGRYEELLELAEKKRPPREDAIRRLKEPCS